MNENMVCPCCGGELTNVCDALTGTEWGCSVIFASSQQADRNGPIGCGARGRYENGAPVANEPDSMRVDKMCDKVIAAMTQSSDSIQVGCLAGHFVSLHMMYADDGWFDYEGDEPLWRFDYEYFEKSMKSYMASLSAE